MTRERSPLGVLFLTLFIDLVGFSIIFPLFPAMLDHYLSVESADGALARLKELLESLAGGDDETREHYTAVLFGGFLGALYSALQFVCAPLWGRLSDRIGRKPVLLLSISGLALSYAIWVFSGSFALLILSRLLGGCMSGNISTASAAVADCTTRETRARGMGIIGAAFGLGFIFGPAIGGLSYWVAGGPESKIDILAEYPDLASIGINPFSAPALVALVLAVLNVLWVARSFPETTTEDQRRKAGELPRPLHPMMMLGRVDIPGVGRASLAYLIFLVAFSGLEFTLTFFAWQFFQYGTGQITALFIFAGLIIALVQGGIVRRVAPKYGERKVAAVGLALLMPGFLLIRFSPPSQVLLYFGLGLMAVGSALAIPCLTSLVSLYTPEERQGAVLGVFRSLGALSRAVGPLIFCSLYWRLGETWPYVTGAILMLAPLLMTTTLPPPEKSPPDAA